MSKIISTFTKCRNNFHFGTPATQNRGEDLTHWPLQSNSESGLIMYRYLGASVTCRSLPFQSSLVRGGLSFSAFPSAPLSLFKESFQLVGYGTRTSLLTSKKGNTGARGGPSWALSLEWRSNARPPENAHVKRQNEPFGTLVLLMNKKFPLQASMKLFYGSLEQPICQGDALLSEWGGVARWKLNPWGGWKLKKL